MRPSISGLLNERFVTLVGVLNSELALLERLMFKLAEAEILTRTDESRFLSRILDEVDAVEEDLGSIEVARAMLVGDITAVLGITADNVTLSQLTSHAPDLVIAPLEGLFRRLTETTGEVGEIRESGSRAAIERIDQLNKAIERMEPGAFRQNGYDE